MTGKQNYSRIPAYEALLRKPAGILRPRYTKSEIEALALSLVQVCQYCGDSFVSATPLKVAQFCSIRCMSRATHVANGTRAPDNPTRDRLRGRIEALNLIRKCENCGDPYLQTIRRRKTRFCSNECANLAQRSRQRREVTCEQCETRFVTTQDHGKWPKFCSRRCLRASQRASIDRHCLNCGVIFLAEPTTHRNSDDPNRKYCSKNCHNEAQRTGIIGNCLNCGTEVYATSKTLTQRREGICCSKKCQWEYYKRDRSHAWKGGLIAQNSRPYRRIDRPGYVGKYDGEHRLIAERAIGRNLIRGEVVICLDKNHENLDPANLYICGSQKEFGFLKSGTLPWPEASNLSSYTAEGYTCPEIEVTLHEWTNGYRTSPDTKRKISRHPQADEIIERRKAGASVKELAKAFGTSSSTMATTIAKRL